MADDLLPYYERELQFIRRSAAEFAEKYPDRAGRLQLDPDGECSDPHVERLIEAFALLAGRIRRKTDDEFPEIIESLLDLLYPHYLRPIPSMGIVQFEQDPNQSSGAETAVARGEALTTKPVEGARCQYRTCYPVRMWPLDVAAADVIRPATLPPGLPVSEAFACLRLRLRSRGDLRLHAMGIDRLRFHLAGDPPVNYCLYELLLANVLRVVVRDAPEGPVKGSFETLDSGGVEPVGFQADEGLLPYSDRSFVGYRVLQEYFAFPRKFLFFDLRGLDRLSTAGRSAEVEVLFLLKEFERKERLDLLESGVSERTFRLGCTPIVNLFPRTCEPIRLTHTQTEYRVASDLHNPLAAEVYSVDQVVATSSFSKDVRELRPFYSFRHAEPAESAFWHTSRRRSLRKGDDGAEVYLSFTDLGFETVRPSAEVITVRATCSNRDWPERAPFSGAPGELQLEKGSLLRVRCIGKPTPTLRPPLRRGLQWRLLSHLGLNHLSIVDRGAEALQEILRLYLFSDDAALKKRIAGVRSVRSRPETACLPSEHGLVFASGVAVDIDFDEEEYADGSVFLLASVLERFLGLYSALNSFTRLTARSRQRSEVLKRWPPRSGEQVLV